MAAIKGLAEAVVSLEVRLEKNHVQDDLGCWQKSVPCSRWTDLQFLAWCWPETTLSNSGSPAVLAMWGSLAWPLASPKASKEKKSPAR